jgi:hypothetical protein
MEDKKMFATLKLFPQENAVQRTAKVLFRWGTGVVLAAVGFQAIYSLLITEWE